MKIVEKLWGMEHWHHNDSSYCLKTLIIYHGTMSSLHMHKVKKETFLVTQGRVLLEYGEQERVLAVGDSITIEPWTYHRFRSMTPRSVVVEGSTEHRDEDVFRKEVARRWTKTARPMPVGKQTSASGKGGFVDEG